MEGCVDGGVVRRGWRGVWRVEGCVEGGGLCGCMCV